jgi:hypothetical protein
MCTRCVELGIAWRSRRLWGNRALGQRGACGRYLGTRAARGSETKAKMWGCRPTPPLGAELLPLRGGGRRFGAEVLPLGWRWRRSA